LTGKDVLIDTNPEFFIKMNANILLACLFDLTPKDQSTLSNQ